MIYAPDLSVIIYNTTLIIIYTTPPHLHGCDKQLCWEMLEIAFDDLFNAAFCNVV